MAAKSTPSRFAGKTALVTGAGSGIGQAVASELAHQGAYVLVADLNLYSATMTANQIGQACEPVCLDVTNESAWEWAIQKLLAERERLDILVNCAGISAGSPLPEMSFADWRRVMSVNLDGAFLGTKHALRAMQASGGSIVHVSSASGIRAASGAAAYSASKAGLCMLAKATAKECRDKGIPVRVNTVCPGGVKTPLWTTMPFFQELIRQFGSEEAAFAHLAKATGPFAEPGDIVEGILFLASDDSRFVTGIDLVLDGGYIL